MRRAGIRGNAEHHDVLFLDLIPSIAKAARFFRTAWRIVSGIEVHDDMLAPEVFQRHRLSGYILQRKKRREFAFLNGLAIILRFL